MKSLHVSIPKQQMTLSENGEVIKTYTISSSRIGIGFEVDSGKTPLGNFVIAEKIGGDQSIYTIFQARVPIGTWNQTAINVGLITSRILWLDGIDPENKNTKERFVYIHGTSEEHVLGTPKSRGCINMGNEDVIELYDLVDVGTPMIMENK